MNPNLIQTGEELSGTSGGYAYIGDYTQNKWVDSGYGSHYQTSNGAVQSDNPPYAYWYSYPSNSSTGGDLVTHCC
jgi:hypothetical protein